jgi:hypothetical protein
MPELFNEDIFALGTAHDELFVSRENGCARYIHGVHGVEETGETLFGRAQKVIVERHEKHGLSQPAKHYSVYRAMSRGMRDSP